MIRWCCYCQKLLDEAPPLTSFEVSHGVCARCAKRLEAGEPLIAEYDAAIRFYRELYAAARVGDRRTCAEMAKRASAAGFGSTELLVGLVQPALVEIGSQWERGRVSVADEHRFTAWCETMLAFVERPSAPEGPLDLLILQAPGNRHVLGPRLAEHVLLDAGIRVEAVVPELPPDEIVALVRTRAPSWVGFSCALPETVDAARDIAAKLGADGYRGRVLLSGQALRRSPETWQSSDTATICLTLGYARELVLRHRR